MRCMCDPADILTATGTETALVTEARRWIGTPYRHQASCRGAGCDCLGLLRGLWRARYGSEPEAVPAYSADWDEIAREDRLWQAANRHLVPVEVASLRPGHVLLFRMRHGAVAKHLGILSAAGAAPTFIHAYSGHGVQETALSPAWRRRLVAGFAWPPITGDL